MELTLYQAMTDEVKSMQAKAKVPTPQAQSSRSSLESTPSRARVASPGVDASNGDRDSVPSTDYLKNVMLQFLETREQKHRLQLIPVLGMLLHFDR